MYRTNRVKCGCKKCLPEHKKTCYCVNCCQKRVREVGLLLSTIEYNNKVAMASKSISIKKITESLMQEVLAS